MATTLDEARARVRDEDNPFMAAFSRLRTAVTKSISTTDDDDGTEYIDDEAMLKSRGGKVATFDGLPGHASGDPEEATKVRARHEADHHAHKAASRTMEHLDDHDDDGEDDFDDEDTDQGTADGDDYDTDGEAHNGASHGELDDDGEDEGEHPDGCRCDECRPGRKKQTMKSVEDVSAEDPGQEFLEAILNSEFADQIDSSEALVFLAERATATIDGQASRIAAMTKSIADMEEARAEEMQWVKQALATLADGIHEALAQGQTNAQTTSALLRSVNGIASDVAIVKSQPASGTVSSGVIALPLSKSASFTAEGTSGGGVAVTKQAIHSALYKSLTAGEIAPPEAASYMERLDGATGLKNVYEMLPDAVKRRVG